jgi:hypothetical protein
LALAAKEKEFRSERKALSAAAQLFEFIIGLDSRHSQKERPPAAPPI